MQKVTHVGVLVRDMEASIAQWSKLFGYSVVKRLDVLPEGLRSVFLSLDGGHASFLIELVEVVDPEDLSNPIARRLKERGEGLMHLCMVDQDTAVVADQLKDQGVRFVVQPTSTGRGDDRLVLNPKDTNGAMVEILSAREWSQVWE
ncbi:MAG: VOC family protein [Burkholderiales bacterium]